MKHYLNNAGAGLMSSATLESIVRYLNLENSVGGYRAAKDSKTLMDEFYIKAATLINASGSSDIAFLDSASRAWNAALHGIRLGQKDLIVTVATEFGTNLVTLFDRAQHVGASVHVIQCDLSGQFDLEELESMLRNGANIVAISHAAAHGSIVNPVREIGKLTKRYGAIYLVDGCQAVGQIPVDVESIQCDAYTATGRKWLRGPRGTGFLYVRPTASLRSTQVDLSSADLVFDSKFKVIGVEVRADARQFELWERSVAGMLGLSSAIGEYLINGSEVVASRVQFLANQLRQSVSANPRLTLVGRVDSESGVVGFYSSQPDREESIRTLFEKRGLEYSEMKDWDCPLHFPKTGQKTIFRLSPHYYTDELTVSVACGLISEI